jgi:nitrogen fixation protein FixH
MMNASTNAAAAGRLTGYHILAMFVAFFGVVIAVNVFMAREAISTFGGVVVENSYVASQHFNRWLDEAASEKALGWDAVTTRSANGHVQVALKGVPAGDIGVTAVARHPLGRMADQAMTFHRTADGGFVSDQALPAGRWRLRLELAVSGKKWRSEADL